MIIDKTDCLGKMKNPLNDAYKFEKVNLVELVGKWWKNGGILSFSTKQEKRVDDI